MEPVWIWGILGLILLATEMASGTFYILWFGIAALCVSTALWVFPAMHSSMQLFMFAALSLGALAIWKLHYKRTSVDLHVGQSQGDDIGRIGIISEPVSLKQNGRIRFAQGVMGSREWAAIADEEIEVGAEAVIISIEGNALRVRHKPTDTV